MSDTEVTQNEAPVEPDTQEAPAQETDWKAEARKWETRAKENSKAAERLAEFEESQKTEQQKLQERAEAAEQALASKEREASRLSVIAAKGIPADYQHLVRGDTDDDLIAAADAVAALVARSAKDPLIIPSEGNTPERSPGNASDWLRDLPRN